MGRTQWEAIAEAIRAQIEGGELSPGDRVRSESEIAEEWGVSRPTAHRALHELQRQGWLVRQRRWGTVVASRLPEQKTGRIAFLVDRFGHSVNFPQSSLLRGLHEGLGDDIELVLTQSDSNLDVEARQLKKLEKSVDGIIICPISNPRNNPLIQGLFDSGYPVVVLDRFPKGLNVDTVATDNEAATLGAISALVDRGHERIAFFSFHKPDFSSVKERHGAYVRALAQVGVEDASELTRWLPKELETDHGLLTRMVADALFTLVNGKEKITALFCVEDLVAATVLQAAEQLGLNIPNDLELATFNDWPPMMLRTPWNIHRIVQRSHDLGLQAARLLRKRATAGLGEPEVIRVAADFIVADAGLRPVQEAVVGPDHPQWFTNGGN